MGARRIQVHVVTVVMLSWWLPMAVNAANYQRFGNEAVERSHRTKRSDMASYHWSQWFNSDNPENSDGDFETIDSIEKSHEICGIGETMGRAECRIAGTNDTFDSTTTAFLDDLLFQACSIHGLICLNIQQASGLCKDYEVRFRCRGFPADDGDDDSLFPNFDFKIYIILAVVPVVVVTLRIVWSCCCKDRLKRRRQRQQQRRRRSHRGSTASSTSSTLSSQASIDSTLALPPPSYVDLFGSHRQSGVFTISQGVGQGTCKACGKSILPPGAATATAADVTATSAASTTTTSAATSSPTTTTTTDTAGNARSGGGLRRIYSFSGPSGATYLALEDPGFPADSSTDDLAPADTTAPAPPVGGATRLRRIVSFSGPSGATYLALENPVLSAAASTSDSATKTPAAGGPNLRRIVSFSGPSGATVLALAEPVYPVCSSSTTDDAVNADSEDVFLESGDGTEKNTNTTGSLSQQNPNVISAPVRGPLSSTGSATGTASTECMCACHSQAQQHGHVNMAFTWETCDQVDSANVRVMPPGMHRPVFGFSRIGSVTSFTSFTSFASVTEPPDYEEALEILRKSGLLVEDEKVAV